MQIFRLLILLPMLASAEEMIPTQYYTGIGLAHYDLNSDEESIAAESFNPEFEFGFLQPVFHSENMGNFSVGSGINFTLPGVNIKSKTKTVVNLDAIVGQYDVGIFSLRAKIGVSRLSRQFASYGYFLETAAFYRISNTYSFGLKNKLYSTDTDNVGSISDKYTTIKLVTVAFIRQF